MSREKLMLELDLCNTTQVAYTSVNIYIALLHLCCNNTVKLLVGVGFIYSTVLSFFTTGASFFSVLQKVATKTHAETE